MKTEDLCEQLYASTEHDSSPLHPSHLLILHGVKKVEVSEILTRDIQRSLCNDTLPPCVITSPRGCYQVLSSQDWVWVMVVKKA